MEEITKRKLGFVAQNIKSRTSAKANDVDQNYFGLADRLYVMCTFLNAHQEIVSEEEMKKFFELVDSVDQIHTMTRKRTLSDEEIELIEDAVVEEEKSLEGLYGFGALDLFSEGEEEESLASPEAVERLKNVCLSIKKDVDFVSIQFILNKGRLQSGGFSDEIESLYTRLMDFFGSQLEVLSNLADDMPLEEYEACKSKLIAISYALKKLHIAITTTDVFRYYEAVEQLRKIDATLNAPSQKSAVSM